MQHPNPHITEQHVRDGMAYANVLVRQMMRQTGRRPSPDEWDDLRGAAYLAVATAANYYRPERGAWSTLVHLLVRRTVGREHIRQARKACEIAGLGVCPEYVERTLALECPDAAHALTAAEDPYADLYAAVEALPPHYRYAIVQRYWGEQGHAEIGAAFGKGRNSAHSLVKLGRARLRETLSAGTDRP